MLTAEEFKEVADAINLDTTLTSEQAKSLLATVYELDANLVIVQNALELTLTNAEEVMPAIAEKILAMSGRTDQKAKKKAAEFAADVMARYQYATHMYLQGAFEEAEVMLTKLKNGETFESLTEQPTETTTTEETNNEENK
jgi:hypothetical protein